MAAYRAARVVKSKKDAIATDVHFQINEAGDVVPGSLKVAKLDVLTVLMWSIGLSSRMLDDYIAQPH